MKGGYKLRNQKLDLCNFAKIGTCICTETAFYQFWWLTAVRPPVTMQPPNKSSVYVEEGIDSETRIHSGHNRVDS